MIPRLSLASALVLALIPPNAAAADDWPQFRGPTGQGLAAGTGPLKWTAASGVAWKTAVPGSGWASPVLADGTIVLAAAVGDSRTLAALAYDTASGDLLWRTDLFEPTQAELDARHAKNSFASATPVLDGGIAYLHFGHMGTAAVDLADGAVLWKRKIPYPPMHGSGSSPVLAAGKLIFNADAARNPTVVALDAATGELAWRVERGVEVRSPFSFSTPLVIENGGRTEVVSPGSGMVGAYRPADGELLWKVTYDQGYSVVPRPVESGGRLYVTTGFGHPNLLAIRLEPGTRGDLTDSHLVWENERLIPKTPSIVAADGHLAVVDDTGRVSYFDAATGDTLWNLRLAGNFSASPVLAAGKYLYALTEDGIAYVIEISADEGKVIYQTDMGDRLFASPAVIGETLYLRSESALWKITGE